MAPISLDIASASRQASMTAALKVETQWFNASTPSS